MYVPLALHIPEGGTTPELMELCAVTERLAEGVDALLTPDTLEKLKQTQREERELAVHIVIAEQNAAEEVDRECQIGVQETPEHQPDSTGSRTGSATERHVTAKEAGNEMLTKEQREDSFLLLPWGQTREGTHGMFTDGLLFHRELLNGRQCNQLVLPETRRREVLELAHDAPCGGHFSGKKMKERPNPATFCHPYGGSELTETDNVNNVSPSRRSSLKEHRRGFAVIATGGGILSQTRLETAM
ncbi:hypothetical protein HPB52_004831 [Rhipicephalus sanguineus]|uniref:Uncharacterized protein n=1 Tax=Rhipicephalus sanguineus TaxID=34632 RepID=A0A9D4PUB8_RHISA|nr:hypothetical protein HPB52_004831 [Rhipicephalus sanguineus]